MLVRKRKKIIKKRVLIALFISILIITVSIGVVNALLTPKSPEYVVDEKIAFNDNKFKSHVILPITTKNEVNIYIEYYIGNVVKDFKSSLGSNNEDAAEINISYQLLHEDSNFLTLGFDIYSIIPYSAHGDSVFKTLTFNMLTGSIVKLENLFIDTQHYNNFRELITLEIKNRIVKKEDPYISEDEIVSIIDSLDDYKIDESGIELIFQKYEIAPGSDGVQKIHINKDLVKGFLIDFDDSESVGENVINVIERETTTKIREEMKNNKYVALTFDDGPHPIYTQQILDTLKKHDVKATFFLLGQQIEKYPEIVVRIYNEGHSIANHTWDHYDLTKLDLDGQLSQINRTFDFLKKIGVNPTNLVRPPYGAFDGVSALDKEDAYVLWNVDSNDWKEKDPNRVIETVVNDVEDRSIVLMHDIHKVTVESLDSIIVSLKNAGYTLIDMESYMEVSGTPSQSIYKLPKID